MSFECIQASLAKSLGPIVASLKNGDCRFLYLDSVTSTDANGFPNPQNTPRTTDYFDCVWKTKLFNEKEVAEQIRGLTGYVITVPVSLNNSAVVSDASDKCQLRAKFNGLTRTTKILEIVSIASNGITQTIIAVESGDVALDENAPTVPEGFTFSAGSEYCNAAWEESIDEESGVQNYVLEIRIDS